MEEETEVCKVRILSRVAQSQAVRDLGLGRTPWTLGSSDHLRAGLTAGPASISRCQVPTRSQAPQGRKCRENRAHPCLGKGPRCLGKLGSGWVPCLSFKNDYCFFHKGPSICQGEGETVPMETGQRLSSRGYPGFSFGKCVFAKVGVAVRDRECEGVMPLRTPPTPPWPL